MAACYLLGKTYISASIHDNDEIPMAIVMFSGSGFTAYISYRDVSTKAALYCIG